VKAQVYSIQAANPRHGHEWQVWQDVKLPDGKILIPGVIDSVTTFVEHPDLVAQRIVQYANLVGRENVIAAPDCGFGNFSRGPRGCIQILCGPSSRHSSMVRALPATGYGTGSPELIRVGMR
jgi:hypothetical protein